MDSETVEYYVASSAYSSMAASNALVLQGGTYSRVTGVTYAELRSPVDVYLSAGGTFAFRDADNEYATVASIASATGAASFGSLTLTTKLADSYISSAATWNAKLSAETDPIVGAIDGIIEADGEGNISAATINAGTDLSADLEEETHSTEHAVSAADSVFPADPNADRVLMWDDDPGELTWIDHTIGSAVQAWDADLDTMAAAGIGIADDDMLQVDSAVAADNEYARFTANGLESRSVSEMKADLWLAPTTTTATDDNAAETWDWSVSNRHQITLDNTQTPCELTFSHEPNESEGFTLILIQDATGGTEITWPATIYWSGGTEPTVAQGASERTVCTFRRINSVTYGAGFEYAQAP